MAQVTVGVPVYNAETLRPPRVTIGVPVYNSESLLQQCLENLAAQTFTDFKVIILDNASSDGTATIARAFADRDRRFEYRCQPRNVGAKQNFADVLEMADTPYFMWRADDDLSDAYFVQETVRLLDAAPQAALAVGQAAYEKNGRTRITPFPHRWPLEPAFLYRIRLLIRSRASWIYALFRTEELKASLRSVYASFPHVNAFDHLVLFPFLMTLRVVGSNRTKFTTRFIERTQTPAKRGFLDPGPMATLRADFVRYCNEQTPKLLTGQAAAAVLMRPIFWMYAERSYRFPKILNARLRLMLGQAPTGKAKSYD